MFEGQVVAVVVPAYNEARLITRVLATMPSWVDSIYVVDDASEDATVACAEAVADSRVAVLRHDVNRGVGAAIVTGYVAAFAAGASVAVVMAGDGQMDPSELPALITPIARGEADYVKGDRLSFTGAFARMPLPRFVGNHALSALTRLATGLETRDSQCGYTALSAEGAARLPLTTLWPRYGYPNDLLATAAGAGLRILDVPVRPIYGEEISGVGLHHALFVVPYVLARAAARRVARNASAAPTTRAPEPAPLYTTK